MEVIRISSFDGQSVWVDSQNELFEVGNFLGGGAAGTVYECEHVRSHERFALKILNPLGYKIITPPMLRRLSIIHKGLTFNDNDKTELAPKKEHIWWLLNGPTKQFLACYYSEKQSTVKELSLNQCIDIWGTEDAILDECDNPNVYDPITALTSNTNNRAPTLPIYPPKYVEFLRKRNKIFREIRNMRKISNHPNVIRLEGVLELIQESKATLFLVMELANGGELFDRIKIDCGTREDTAKIFFRQLLEGVKHCHDQGVCHRDLKPENLLLQDDGVNGTILKIADFGFSAHFNHNFDSGNGNEMGGSVFQSPNLAGGNDDHALRVLKSIVGSPFYVAPEVMQASGYDGPKVDVWSLGVILYAMLAGNLPFGQDLANCKRFKHFCKWVREQTANGVKFWNDANLEYPPWLFPAKFSPAAKGLIIAMLHPDPANRISVDDAMQHPLCGVQNLPLKPSDHNANRPPLPQASEKLQINASPQKIIHSQPQTPAQPQREIDGDVDEMDIANPMQERNSSGNNDYDDEVAMFKMEEEEDDDREDEVKANGSATSSSTSTAAMVSQSQSNDSQQQKAPAQLSGLSLQLANQPKIINGSTLLSSSYQGSTLTIPFVPPTYLNDTCVRDLIVNQNEEDDEEPSPHPHHSSGGFAMHINSSGSTGQHMSSANGMLYRQDSNSSENRMLRNFTDVVKRSTRFITSVPAAEVLSKIEAILQEVRVNRIETPAGYITGVDLNWELFRLEVYGQDSSVSHPSSNQGHNTPGMNASQPICALQLYQMPNNSSNSQSIAASPSPMNGFLQSPSQSCGSWYMASSLGAAAGAEPAPLIMVEFIRGQIEIFGFKRFYQWVRLRLSELVKKDYAMSLFDQAASPVFDRMMYQRYQQIS